MIYQPRPLRPGFERERGMIFRPRASVSGLARWRVFDADGSPALVDVVDRHGETRRVHGLPWQRNVITDTFLDFPSTQSGQGKPTWSARAWLAVGTGSTAPDPADIALDAEVEKGNTTVTTPAQYNIDGGVFDVDGTDYLYRHAVKRRVTMTGDRNLTEFGFRPATTGDLHIRHLFRDELGDPVTISLLTGKILEVEHEFRIRVPRSGTFDTVTVEERDAANNVTSSTDYDVEFGIVTGGNNFSKQGAFEYLTMGSAVGFFLTGYSQAFTLPLTTIPTAAGSPAAAVVAGYTLGSHQRVYTATATITQMNGTLTGVGLRNSQTFGLNGTAQYVAKFTDPTTFAKLSTHTFALGFRTSWGREGS